MSAKETIYKILASDTKKEVEVNLASVADFNTAASQFAKLREDVIASQREAAAALPRFAAPASKLRRSFAEFTRLSIELLRMESDIRAQAKELGVPFSSLPGASNWEQALSDIASIERESKKILDIYNKIG
jgi:hypothetical protein